MTSGCLDGMMLPLGSGESVAETSNPNQPARPADAAMGCAVLFAIGAIVWFLFLSGPSASDLAKRPTVATDADSLFLEFSRNEVAARNRFNDRNLIITGNIAEISDASPGGALELATFAPNATVSVAFAEGARDALAKLNAGDQIRTRCTGLTNYGASVNLSDCSPPELTGN